MREAFGKDAGCPDLFGLLQGREPTYPELRRALAGYLGGLEAPLCLCGLSLGGVLALHYTAEHPQRVASLALLGTPFVMPKGLLALQNAVFSLLPEKSFRQTGLGKRETLALTRSMADLDFRGELGRIACPVLSACGSRDRANRKAARALAERVPRGRFALVEGAGHEVNRDAPEALAALLRAFFPGGGDGK